MLWWKIVADRECFGERKWQTVNALVKDICSPWMLWWKIGVDRECFGKIYQQTVNALVNYMRRPWMLWWKIVWIFASQIIGRSKNLWNVGNGGQEGKMETNSCSKSFPSVAYCLPRQEENKSTNKERSGLNEIFTFSTEILLNSFPSRLNFLMRPNKYIF